MKTVTSSLFILVLSFGALRTQSEGWRGIVPLRSTRADVERLLGPPDRPGEQSYDLEGEVIFIQYSGGRCEVSGPGGWKVPRDTVVSLTVRSKTALPFADLQIDTSKYEQKEGGHVPGYVYYTNKEEGITVEVFKGEVTGISYEPPLRDEHLRCPEPAGEGGSGSKPGASSGRAAQSLGECPIISIEGPQSGRRPGGEYTLTGLIAGSDPSFMPTWKWSVSAGVIVDGQGTGKVKIDTSGAGCDPVTVTLEVGGAIPRECPAVKTYTIKQSNP